MVRCITIDKIERLQSKHSSGLKSNAHAALILLCYVLISTACIIFAISAILGYIRKRDRW